MANNERYRFSRGEDGYVIFDSKGYVLEAKGFGSLMWSTSPNIDKELVGKHVDELAEMLKKNGAYADAYINFEAIVHVGLLKKMLSQKSN